MRGIWLRRIVAFTLAAGLASACSYETSPLDPNASVTIRGHVAGVATGATVALLPGGALSDLLAFATFPPGCFGCFAPDGRTAHVDGHGNYSFSVKGRDTQTLLGGLRRLGVYVRDTRAGIKGTVARGGTVIDFAVRRDHVALPDVAVWRSAPDVRAAGDDIAVTPPAPPTGVSATSFTVHLGDADDHELATSSSADGQTVHLDRRLLEDGPGRVWVTAKDGVGDTDRLMVGPTVAVLGVRAPLSRSATCHTFTATHQVRALTPCGLTDGDLLDTDVAGHDEGACIDLNGEEEARCQQITSTVEIDLAHPVDVAEVVVSGRWLGTTIEVSSNGRDFVAFGPAGAQRVTPLPPSPDDPPPPTVIAGKGNAIVALRITGVSSVSEVAVW